MMKRIISATALLLAMACTGVCDTLYVDNRETDTIYPERLNLRAEPAQTGGILGLYYTGAAVEAERTDDMAEGYTKVSIGGVNGYMATTYLITAEEAAARYGEGSSFGNCRAAKVNLSGLWEAEIAVHAQTDFASDTVATLRTGDDVQLIGILGDDWAYIAVPGETKTYGYVPLHALTDEMVHEALIVAGSEADTRTMLYSAPNDRAKTLMTLKNGTACFSLFGRKEGNWVKVRVGGVSGWIRYTQADNLSPIADASARSTVPYYPLVMQTKTDALLCSVAGDTTSAYMTLGQDMKVEVLAELDQYVYVRTMEGGAGAYDSGDYGYIALSQLALAQAEGGAGVAQADDGDLPVLLMAAPQDDAQMLGALIPGAQVRITDFTQSDYVQVALGGVTGYVRKAYIRALGDGSVEPSERIPQRANVLRDVQLMDRPEGGGGAGVSAGSRVYMLAALGDWAFVQADARPGFEAGEPTMGFVPLSALNAPASTTHLTAHVNTDKVNMRAKASTQGEIIGKARTGERLRVADYGQKWTCVVTPAGKRGYVMTTYLEFE